MPADASRARPTRPGARFLHLSIASFLVTLGTTALVHEVLALPAATAYLSGLAVALFQNFLGMRYYVYPGSTAPLLPQFVQFLGASAAFRMAEYIAFLLLQTGTDLPYLIAATIVTASSFVTKLLFYRVAVFR